MMLSIKGLHVYIDELTVPNRSGKVNDEEWKYIYNRIYDITGIGYDAIYNIKVRRKSIDARKGKRLAYIYNLDVDTGLSNNSLKNIVKKTRKKDVHLEITGVAEQLFEPVIVEAVNISSDTGIRDINTGRGYFNEHCDEDRPVVAGAGPAGLFCTYILALNGFRPVLIEQGKQMDDRIADVDDFWKDCSKLQPYSNVSFGEGGAGTFSDGKLNTSVKDPSGRIDYVKRVFIEHGAPEEIEYLAKPHIGTDELRTVIVNLRNSIIAAGGEVYFGTKLEDIYVKDGHITGIRVRNNSSYDISCSRLVLATGHSARDTYSMLKGKLDMESKDFAIGLRVEHSQDFINKTQYGRLHNMLPAADYKLRFHSTNGRSVYSFCMCPGGYVVNASSENNMTVTNGMSNHSRDSGYANSAIVVNVTRDDYGSDDVLAGVEFQRRWERAAYGIEGGRIPSEKYGDYADGRLRHALPDYVSSAIEEAMEHFDSMMPGFADDDVKMYGVETRTSAPVRILRDADGNSSVKGIYPCGEGAGYAGGIMSAAVDGIKVAHMIIKGYN